VRKSMPTFAKDI